MKILFALLFMVTSALAADVKMDWTGDPGAYGYRISMSTDMGTTWHTPVDAGQTRPFVYPNVPEDKLVLFKIAAYNAVATAWNEFAGAWYDHRKKLSFPNRIGIE